MKEVLKELRQARKLLQLPDCWDQEGAKRISPKAFDRTSEFLKQLVKDVPKLKVPEINPLPTGGLDISWRSGPKNDIRLLVSISDIEMGWYGDVDLVDKIKGRQSGCHNAALTKWVKEHLQ